MIRLAWEKLRALTGRRRFDREFEAELQSHFEELVDEHAARGIAPAEARRAARLKLGPAAAAAEIHREERGIVWLESLARDVKLGARNLARSWGLTAAAILSLALGIGANTGVFSLMDQALYRALAVRDPERLMLLNPRGPAFGNPRGSYDLSHPMFRDLRAGNKVFSGMFGRQLMPANTGYQGSTERILAEIVTGGYFETLGIGAHLGRVIGPDDDRLPDAHPVCVLSFGYWQARFQSDPAIVGKSLAINGRAFTIIGVSAAGYEGLEVEMVPQLRVPSMMKAAMSYGRPELDDRRARWMNVYGRLKPGIAPPEARQSLQPLYTGLLELESKLPEFARAPRDRVERLRKGTLELVPAAERRLADGGRVKQTSLLLFAVAGMVLLIACANIANLLLARGTARAQEIAVRLALGATRARLVRQLLVESMLLALGGGAAGLLVAGWVMRATLSFAPAEMVTMIKPVVDARALAFAFAASLATGLIFGIAPALAATRSGVGAVMKDRTAAIAGGSHWLRKTLVAAQVALSVALLVMAAWFVRSLRNLQTREAGFRAENLLAFSVDPGLNGYGPEKAGHLRRALHERIAALPGVESVAFSRYRILGGEYNYQTAQTDAASQLASSERWTFYDLAGPGYLETIGLTLSAGRGFEPGDHTPGRPAAALVNQTFARHFFGGENAIGRRIGLGPEGTPRPLEVVGVLKDSTYAWMRSTHEPLLLAPMVDTSSPSPLSVYVRYRGEAGALYPALRRAVAELDPSLPVFQLRTMARQVEERLLLERITATFSSGFGILATLLAIVGLYGVMAYIVAGRTREIGVRMALGSDARGVVWLILREVLVLAGSGTAAGLVLAAALSQPAKALLYAVTPMDPGAVGGAALLLLAVATAAGLLPAWRASQVDPMRALREQ